MPAPAGAIAVLLPIYIHLLGIPRVGFPVALTLVYTLLIAFLMISRVPVFSGKRVGKRVRPEMVLPVFLLVVLFVALLISYPWEVLTVGTILYLGSLPFGVAAYKRLAEQDAVAKSDAASPAATGDTPADPHPAIPPGGGETERPVRLN